MVLLVTNVGLFILLFAVGAFASVRARPQVRLAALAVSAGVCLPAISYSLCYLHVFDDCAWFYQIRSYSVANYYPGLLGWLAGWLFGSVRRARIIIIGAALPFVFIPFAKPLLVPLSASSLRNEWRDGVCLQTSPSTCGPASVATLLAQNFNDHVNEATIAQASLSSATGTEVWYLAQFLRRRGYQVSFHTKCAPVPNSVAGTRSGTAGHFVAVLVHDGRYEIADPLSGIISEVRGQGVAFTGFSMQISKSL